MRKFLKVVSVMLTMLLVVSSLTGCSSKPSTTTEDLKWDREVDFLVVGYGLAGQAAAIEASDIDPNAKILVLEKMPAHLAGGNTIASGQTFIVPSTDAVEGFKTYIRECNEPNPIPEEYLDFMGVEFADQIGWIVGQMEKVDYEVGYVGGGPLKWGKLVVEFDDLKGADFEGTSAHIRAKGGPSFEAGGIWKGFNAAVKAKSNVEVLYETPAIDLIQDPLTKEVLGAIAIGADGKEIRIKASKGVLLSCGGFENNIEMQRNFHGMDEVYTAGTPGNTGDGIGMLMRVGAKMWHMNNQTQSGGFWLGIKVPEYEATFMRNMTFKSGAWIEIDSENERFYDEATTYHRQHMKYKEHGRYVDLHHERALPVHLIFDSQLANTETVASQWLSWPITTEGYVWSKDNTTEIEKGWIIKADSIEELAAKIDRDPVELKATIDRYNQMATSGVDGDFNRKAENMQPINQAPYYAVSLTPTLVATTGGAERNTKSQVLDWNNEPIANLYEAGELGSFVSNLYQNGVFLSEAIMSGRAAAQHAFNGKSTVKTEVIVEEEAPTEEIKDGVYSAIYKGQHGDITIEVTITGGKISKVDATEGKENMFMDEQQYTSYTKEIVTRNSSEIDAISGATMDCQGISGAVKEAVNK